MNSRSQQHDPTSPQPQTSNAPCQHPRVQIVSHGVDAEFVECIDCREVFDPSEFRDMAIEEKLAREEFDA